MNRHLVGYVAVAVVAGGGSALAAESLGGSRQQIKGCVGKDGTLRVVKPNARCKRGERALTWSQTGPRGPRGTPGPKGDRGPPGPATGAASGALTGNYPNPQLARGSVGPAQLALTQTASLASTATTTTFSQPVSVTVSVPSANALVEIDARVRLKTSNGADPVTVDLQESSSGISDTVGQLFSSASTTGTETLLSAPGNDTGVPFTFPGAAGGPIMVTPGEVGSWTYALTLVAFGGATATMFNGAQLYAVVLQ